MTVCYGTDENNREVCVKDAPYGEVQISYNYKPRLDSESNNIVSIQTGYTVYVHVGVGNNLHPSSRPVCYPKRINYYKVDKQPQWKV